VIEKMAIPEGLDVLQSGDGGVVIRRVWRNWWTVIPMAGFLVFWFGFIGCWYYMAFTQKHSPPLMLILFPLLHVAAGLGLAYTLICNVVNRTDLSVSPLSVKCFTGPMPWIGNREVSSAEIRGVAVRERRGNKGRVRYALMYVDPANKERTLISGITRKEQAEFMEASIRELLGLRDGAS